MHAFGGILNIIVFCLILGLLIFPFRLIVSTANISGEMEKDVQHRHSRTKRTPPFSFPPFIRGLGFLGSPIRFPSFRPLSARSSPPFGVGPESWRFGLPFPRLEIFERGGFRQQFGSPGFPRMGTGVDQSRSSGRSDVLRSSPVVVETPDGTQTIFIGRGGTRPNIVLLRGGDATGSFSQRGSSTISATDPGIRSNPLPICTSGTVLRCRPWPAGTDPTSAHQCYGDCPGRTCYVDCLCTCDTEQVPRIMLARMVGLSREGATTTIDLGPVGSRLGDLPFSSGNADLTTSGIRNVGGNPPSSANSAEPGVMGIPIPVSESAASLPELGVSEVNLGIVPEPGISFVSAFDVAASRLAGARDGTSADPSAVVPLEAPAGKIQVNVKANDPSLIIGAGPEIDIMAKGLTMAGQDTGFGLRPVSDLSRAYTEAGNLNTLLNQPLGGIGEPTFAVDPSIEFINAATNPVVDITDTRNSDSKTFGAIDVPVLGSARKPQALRLPAPGPAPAPPLKPGSNNGANANLHATNEIKIKTDGSNFPVLDTSLKSLSSSNNMDTFSDPNALMSLLTAFNGQVRADKTTGANLSKTAMLSQIANSSTAPLSRLDLLVKDLGFSALFPGGNTHRLFSTKSNSSLNGTSLENTLPLETMLAALVTKGGLEGMTNQQEILGLGPENANFAMLAAVLGMTGGKQGPLQNILNGSNSRNLTFGSETIGQNDQATGNSLSNSNLPGSQLSGKMKGTDQQAVNNRIDGRASRNNLFLSPSRPAGGKSGGGNLNWTHSKIALDTANGTNISQNELKTSTSLFGKGSGNVEVHAGATTKECLSKGLEIWCEPVGVWESTPGVTKWCLLNCRDKNNCDRRRCACICIEEKAFRLKFEKLPIKSP